MAIFLVDLENVGMSGLKGIEKLSENNRVEIFYGTKTGSIAFDKHVELSRLRVEIDYHKAAKTGKNYLDFQMGTYLGWLIGKGETGKFFIISKDTGYDSVIDFWKTQKPELTIVRQGQIQSEKADSTKAGAEKKETAKKAEKKEIAKKKENTKKTEKLPESVKKKIRKAVKDEKLQGGSYTRLYECVVKYSDKQAFNTALVKTFQQKRGNQLYTLIRDIFTEYHAEASAIK